MAAMAIKRQSLKRCAPAALRKPLRRQQRRCWRRALASASRNICGERRHQKKARAYRAAHGIKRAKSFIGKSRLAYVAVSA
jgi:hypothetical protein